MAGYNKLNFGGGRMKTFESDVYYQRARGAGGLFKSMRTAGGVGSIFSNLVTSVLPVLKTVVKGALNVGKTAIKSKVGQKIAKELKDTATKGAINAVGEVISGRNPVDAAQDQIAKARQRVGKTVPKILSDAQKAERKAKDANKKKSLKKGKAKTNVKNKKAKGASGGKKAKGTSGGKKGKGKSSCKKASGGKKTFKKNVSSKVKVGAKKQDVFHRAAKKKG